ncbi:hypothetical protein ACS5NO_10185 [Larkinella sp. GY13]|uniref:hypothetical protein n=1 Tax=Larkinella sp. GY13 TaxID=3453720 RepID=UPI003EEFBA2A
MRRFLSLLHNKEFLVKYYSSVLVQSVPFIRFLGRLLTGLPFHGDYVPSGKSLEVKAGFAQSIL